MKAFQQLVAALRQLGINIPAGWMVLIVLLVPMVIGAAVFLYPKWKEWRETRKAQAPDIDKGNSSLPPPSQLASYRLRRAWNRFLRDLPALYRRSILNFEQFIVLGAEGSGKTGLVDAYTDWKRQTKQFVGTQTYDPDLQVYLGSNAVVMELPASVLRDTSAKCRTALTHLWRPLYRKRAVVVVVAVDPIRLGEETPDAIDDLAETIRGKVNLLARIRGTAVELRVALTHLGEIEGYREYAAFCRDQGISTRIPIRLKADEKIAAQLTRWFEGARGDFPRALTSVSSADYKRTVAFLRKAPDIVPTLARFLDCLFAHEALSPDPICGGAYLASEKAGASSPFSSPVQQEPGPDPRRKHLIAAVVVAASIVLYLGAAYRQQSSRWSLAARAMDEYRPSTYGTDAEVQRRTAISDFTWRSKGWMMTHPDFFSSARTRMRSRMSEKIREELLVPKLKEVAERGTLQEGGTPLQTRRSLYFLALIHSDRADGMHILAPGREEVWTLMTGLQGDVIRDFLENTDVAWRKPIAFELGEREVDSRDSAIYWLGFLRSIAETIAAGVVSPDDLRALQSRAAQLSDNIERFDHDDITRTILGELDQAAGIVPVGGTSVDLTDAYSPKYADFLQSIVQSDVYTQRERFRSILRVVRGSAIDAADTPLLRNLVDRLGLLETPVGDTPANIEGEVRLRVADQEFVFDTRKWRELIRNSEVSEQIARFMRYGEERSIFFSSEMNNDLRPVLWNPTNDGSSIFIGRATIEGRYTQEAYAKNVREVTKRLESTLDAAKVPEAQKKQLSDFVRDQIRRYAAEYRAQITRFYQTFGLRTPSQEALRVALAQMMSDNSSFNDFLVAVDQNTHVETDSPLLQPMSDAMAEYESFHNVVNATSGAPELSKYRAILGQLLADLGPSEAGGTAPPGATPDTLEKELTPSGRVVLANLRGEKGSYASLVGQWLQSIKLPEDQQRPFMAPLNQLTVLGRDDIQRALQRVWYSDILPDVQRIAAQFPFDPESKDDATPADLTSLFNPQTGRFFDLFRRYIEPVSEFPDGGSFRLRRSIGEQLKLPADMYTVINGVAALSARLWESSGKPTPLTFRVATVPFEHGIDPHAAVTLIYLNIGDTPVFDFNQKPGLATVRFDWTKESSSQVGVQLTDLDTKENAFPEPIVVEGSPWSFLHVLKRAVVAPVKQPAGALLYTWSIKHRVGGTEATNARFVLTGDPWSTFTLGRVIKAAPIRPAAVN